MSTILLFCARAPKSAWRRTSGADGLSVGCRSSLLAALLGMFLFSFVGCNKEPQGALSVTVYYDNGVPAEGATVTLSPGKATAITSADGVAEFTSVDAMTYSVTANSLGLEGNASVVVFENQRVEILVRMQGNLASVLPAEIELIAPVASDSLYARQNITIVARVTIPGRAPSDFDDITWSIPALDLSGKPSVYEDQVIFSVRAAEAGTYTGSIRVKTDYPEATVLPFTLSVRPEALLELTVDSSTKDGVRLAWNRYRNQFEFEGYKVMRAAAGCDLDDYRTPWEEIALIRDVRTLSYIDTSATPLSRKVCYRIVVNRAYSYEEGGMSEVISYVPTGINWLGFVPSQLLGHATNPVLVYATDPKEKRIVLYDLNSGTEKASAQLSGTLTKAVLGDAGAGRELFVGSSNGNVYVLDPNTLARRALISTVQACTGVAVFEDGFLLISDDRQNGNTSSYRTYRRDDGSLIDGSVSKYRPAVLERIPGQRAAIAVETTNDGAPAQYLGFDAAGRFVEQVSGPYPGREAVTPALLQMSPDGRYWITSYNLNLYRADASLGFLGRLDTDVNYVGGFVIAEDGARIYISSATYPANGKESYQLTVSAFPSRLTEKKIRLRCRGSFVALLADGSVATAQGGSTSAFTSESEGPAMIVVRP